MVRPFNPDYYYSNALAGTTAVVAAIVGNQATWKRPCRVATTAEIPIATALNAGDSIDGVTLAADDRVLVWVQDDASQNGIIVVGATPGRATDFDSDGEIRGALVSVLDGSTYGGRLFRNTNTAAIVVDTDDVTFELLYTSEPAMQTGGPLLVADIPAGSPLVFADLLQNDAGDDMLYADSW